MNGVSEGESHSNPHINETCCAYNLLKLTKDLNCFNPDDARYMDYYERTLYNQIIGSLHPEHYQTTYQYAVGLKHRNHGATKLHNLPAAEVRDLKIM